MTMNVLSLLSLLLVFYCGYGNGTQKPSACEQFKTTPDMLKFCTGVESLFTDYGKFFDENVFGTKETLDLAMEAVDSTLKTCERYGRCPANNRVRCYLPKMPQVGSVCKRMMILKSPYASCLRKLQNQTISSPELKNLVNDFTKDGIRKKCEDLKERSILMEALFNECDEGKETKNVFKYYLRDLKSYYNCTYDS